MRTDLGRACKAAGVARFGLRELRHRQLSLRIRDGLTATEVAARAGHARSSVTLDVYSYVLVDDRELTRAGVLRVDGYLSRPACPPARRRAGPRLVIIAVP